MAVKVCSEAARERETYRFAAAELVGLVHQTNAALIESSTLHVSPDNVLTGLAELVALRLDAARATISLFDQRWQYIIAEATPRLALVPGAIPGEDAQLLLCGTAVPRQLSICDHVISRKLEDAQVQGDDSQPLFVVADISPRLVENPYFKSWPHRYYAGVPLRTPKGIEIGVLSIYADEPRGELDDALVSLMQDVSQTIVDYLATKRSSNSHRRADRMVRGIGTFIEDESSLSGWWGGSEMESFQDLASKPEGTLNARQQGLQRRRTASDVRLQHSPSVEARQPGNPKTPELPNVEEDSETTAAKHTFSKAANILRESIEVEGAIFLDASISTFGGGISRGDLGHGHRSSSSTSSSSDDSSRNVSTVQKTNTPCRVLGFSNSSQSSIDSAAASQDQSEIPERLLRKLIKRFPRGKVFNFDENGSPSPGDSSSEDAPGTETSSIAAGISPSRPRKDRSFARRVVADLVIELFPKARSVAFVPVWDSHRQRWFAGGFIYTLTSSRIFTPEGELSYLSAFASVVMAEIHHKQEAHVNKTKADLLGSISHELRSPLHGVVFGAELLQDTDLDIFQKDVLNSIENCCRTLMGTIDHLLDWTKINKFKQQSSKERRTVRASQKNDSSNEAALSIHTGMISRTSDVDIADVAEQVVESMFAGHSFQTMSVMRMVEGKQSGDADIDSIRTLDSMQAVEFMASQAGKFGDVRISLGGLVVSLSVHANVPWVFVTQPGAIRRILMNLLGNALKFTTQGYVEVRLEQEVPPGMRPNMHLVSITVSDSGRGISQEFLKHHMFRPFKQEDTLIAGAGLGLSLVQKIVSSLGGSVTAESKLGEGSKVTVKLPLISVLPPSPGHAMLDDMQDEFRDQITELQGLRVAITGYPSPSDQTLNNVTRTALLNEQGILIDVCTNWLRLRVIEPHETAELLPDLILCGDRFLDKAFQDARMDLSTPVVVICRSALVARQLATSTRFTAKVGAGAGIIEFISQPLGPRKLAKILLQCFRRWTKLQEAAMSTQAPSDQTQTKLHSLSLQADSETKSLDQMTDQFSHQNISSRMPDPDVPIAPTEEELPKVDEISPEGPGTPKAEPREPDKLLEGEGEGSGSLTPKKKDRVARYLLVDDNAINLRILAAYMKKLGHAYDTASDGLEALQTFQKGNGQYKCVFMDISMPVMDGFESARRIRTHERNNKLSRCDIYSLTGLASASAQKEAFSSGIDLFLAKPVKLKELSDILEVRKQD